MLSFNKTHDALIQESGERWRGQHGQQFDLAITILAAVNVAAACLMILTILFDARTLAKSRSSSMWFRHVSRFAICIHPAEILPLVISIAIVAQGTIFIVVQTTSRQIVNGNCRLKAQIIWPTLWIVSYTMLTFGFETAFRSLRGKRFSDQKKRSILFCVITTLTLTVATWVPSHVFPRQNACLASLVWWISCYAEIGLVISSSLVLAYIVCAAVIAVRLLRTSQMSHDQRIAATRIVYYLVVNAVIMSLVIPFFAQVLTHSNAIVTSRIAEVALNLLGVIHLVLHVFLRSNADRLALRPIEGTWTKKRRLRLFGPSDLEMTEHITSPVLLEKGSECRFDDDNHTLTSDLRRFSHTARYTSSPAMRTDTGFSEMMNQKRLEKSEYQEPMRSPPQVFLTPCNPRKPSNYSIFPTFRSAMLRTSMSTTFSQDSEEAIQPPKPLRPFNHKRDLSEQSSATLHIGCRLSNLNDIQQSPYPSPKASSFRMPLYGFNRRTVESPPMSPLGTRSHPSSESSQDVVILPLQPNRSLHREHLRNSRLEFLGSIRHGRQRDLSRSQHEHYRRMTMKALPPDPPVTHHESPPAYSSF